jgi:small subunit ribosomal protein S11
MAEKKEAKEKEVKKKAQSSSETNLRAGSKEPRAAPAEAGKKAIEKKVETKVEKKETKVEKKEAKAEVKEAPTENISKSLIDQVRGGMAVEKTAEEKPSQSIPQKAEFIAIVHVHASKNNTVVTATDLSGAETFARATGGMVVKSGREEKTPFAGTLMARKISDALKEKGVTKVDMFIRGKGGHRGQKTPGRAASAVIKAMARSGIRIRRIEHGLDIYLPLNPRQDFHATGRTPPVIHGIDRFSGHLTYNIKRHVIDEIIRCYEGLTVFYDNA